MLFASLYVQTFQLFVDLFVEIALRMLASFAGRLRLLDNFRLYYLFDLHCRLQRLNLLRNFFRLRRRVLCLYIFLNRLSEA